MKTPRAPRLKPETLMMSYGYKPELSEGAIKCPIFQTSTFVFKTAEDGKAFFELAYGHRKCRPREEVGLIYSRINNPDMEILEDRLTMWDGAESAAVFASGMAAIGTTMLELLSPGDLLLHSEPLYGGTDHFFRHVLTRFGITPVSFRADHTKEEIITMVKKSGLSKKLGVIYFESPGNPTNDLIDMAMIVELAKLFSSKTHRVITAVDNTFLGPVFCHPLRHGIDLVLYSATKYIGGHSDVIAGACLGSSDLILRVKALRTFLGAMVSPWTGWLLLRSLETLKVRMTRQMESAHDIALWLAKHPKVERVYYPGLLKKGTRQHEIYAHQCSGPGAMISFDITGGQCAAFTFLNSLRLVKLAVSLGGTESLAEHPYSMTHADVTPEDKVLFGITDNMIRLSVGLEATEDVIRDIEQALKKA